MAYILTGKLGLMLALPPGFASGVFPAAGIAMAAVYLAGSRPLPWIFLGSFALNLWTSLPELSPLTLAAAGCIAAASSLQAAAGGFGLRRLLKLDSAFDTGGVILRFLAASPLAGLPSGLLSLGGLAALGIIKPDQLLVSWTTWWVGDTLGILTFFPLTLSCFGKPAVLWRRRRLVIIPTMLLLLGLVVVIYVQASRMENEKIAADFHAQAQRMHELVRQGFEEQYHILAVLERFMALHEDHVPRREDFQAFVKPSLERFPMLKAIEWVPEVPAERRNRFEAEQRASMARFSITQRDSDGAMVAAGARDRLYPVTYIEPLVGNDAALGFDLGSDPARAAAIAQALASSQVVSTPPLTLVQEQGSQSGLLLMKKVQSTHGQASLVLTVLRMGDFIKHLAPNESLLSLEMVDLASGQTVYGGPPSQASALDEVYRIEFATRSFAFRVSPSNTFIQANRSLQSWAILAVGTLGAGLLGALLLLITGMAARVRLLVGVRTKALSAESQKNRTLLDSASDGIHILDSRGMVLEFSHSFARMLGYSLEEAAALNVKDWDAAIAPEALEKTIQDLIEHPRTFETRHRRKDGSVYDAEVNAKGIELNGESCLYASVRDISERKRLELDLTEAKQRAEDANRAKASFLANMSHEIRTPMNAVLGLARMIGDTELDGLQRDYLSKLDGAARSLLGILNDILDYSKMEAGKLSIETVETDLGKLLEDCARLFAFTADSKGIELVFDIDPGLPERAMVDPLRLTQIFNNLLGNAIKFTNQGHVAFRLMARNRTEGGLELEAQVSDTGIGMNAEQRKRLFTAFEQADGSTTRTFGGTGLGLTITKNLVEMMGGRIDVESELGRGSSFRVWLPCTLPALQAQATVPTPAAARPGRVLIVDPLPTSASALLRQCQVWTQDVAWTDTAEQAAALFERALSQKQAFELCLITRRLPDGDGAQLAERFSLAAAQSPDLSQPILVLLVNSLDRESPSGPARSAPQVARLEKPVLPTRLRAVLSGSPGSSRTRELGTPGPEDSDAAALSGRPVLLVEDNAINQLVARSLLTRLGLEVTLAENGAAAIEAARRQRFAAILMDLQMPEMDGLEATRRIRQGGESRDAPIIAMTAAAMASDRDASLAAGMNDFLTKPINMDELLPVLRRWITA